MKLILRVASPDPPEEAAGGVLPPAFSLLERPRTNFKYSFLASAALHLFGIFVLPPLLTYIPGLEDEKPNNVEVVLLTKSAEELRLILPPRARIRPRSRAGRQGAPSMGRAGAAPAGGGSPKPRRRREPAGEEPVPSPKPVEPAPPAEPAPAPSPKEGDGGERAILIQPPERAAPPEPKPVQVPSLTVWTGPPEHLTRRQPTTPGVPEPPKLSTAVQTPPSMQMPSFLDTPAPVPIPKMEPPPEPPKLPLRSAGASLSMLRPVAPPKPEQVAPPPTPGDQMKGTPAAVISISSTPPEPGKEIVIPPGNRMELGSGGPGKTPGGPVAGPQPSSQAKSSGGGEPSGSVQSSGEGGGSAHSKGIGSGKGPGSGRGPAGKGAGGVGTGTGSGAGAGKGPGTGAATKGSGLGTTGAGPGRTGSGPTGTGTGDRGLPAGPGGTGTTPGGTGSGDVESSFGIAGGTVRVLEAADGSRALQYPADGYFDVIVLETRLGPGMPSAESFLTGRPIHTAYLNVGLRKEWILQYCVQGARKAPEDASSGVISLAAEPTLKAPFVRRVFLPRASQFDSEGVLAFVGVIGPAGHVQAIRAIGEDSAAHQTLLPFLSKWSFRPATEDEKPVPIEFVLVVPVHTNQ